MAISKKIDGFMQKASWIRKMFEDGIALKKKIGEENVFDLTLGNPVMEPPKEFKEELSQLVNSPTKGMHRYMPNAGYPETRTTVADALKKEFGLDFTHEHIIMTVGAGGGLNVVLKTILDDGDEVIIVAPYFVEYIFYVDNHGGILKIAQTNNDFSLNIENIEKEINQKTKAVLTNSPNNPTGRVYSKETLSELASLLEAKQKEFNKEIYLLSDEPYRKIIYDGLNFPSIFSVYDNSIVITSHSKDLSIPGERIGYIALNPKAKDPNRLIGGFTFCNRTLGFVNAPALMQRAITNLQEVSIDVGEYQKKRDLIYGNLTKFGYDVLKPEGAFYFFPKSPIPDDVEFVRGLQKKNVLVVPGSSFGRKGHFRISYCVDDRTIEKALPIFEDAIK